MDIIVEKKCPGCGKISSVVVDAGDYVKWKSGALIQTAMQDLSATEREILITGFCEECQNEIFK